MFKSAFSPLFRHQIFSSAFEFHLKKQNSHRPFLHQNRSFYRLNSTRFHNSQNNWTKWSKFRHNRPLLFTASAFASTALFGVAAIVPSKKEEKWEKLPMEEAILTAAPFVPPLIKRDFPVRLVVKMEADVAILQLTKERKYRGWAFNRTIPGPFIRAREGDLLEVQFTNKDADGIGHNIDFHAVIGPGGGSPVLFAEKDETKVARFRMLYPGLYVYHCAAAPIPQHIANGMYGLILVEPKAKGALPSVDREFYVVQSEFYTEPSLDVDEPNLLEYSYTNGLVENAQSIVFNGREGALTDRPLMAKCGERVRIYFGNVGPNLVSSFHIIGTIFDRVYRDGGLLDPPAHGLQTQLVAPGGTTIVEVEAIVPGTYALVDHAIHRIDKGAIGYLKVSGEAKEYIYLGESLPNPCPGCKVHE